jgi:hypothetical protein
MFRLREMLAASALAAMALASGPAFAGDLMLAKGDATDLITSDVGKPFWTLQAQCAGMFGAAYAYDTAHNRAPDAEKMKQNGVDMLDSALARLELDRGIDRNAAMALAADQVEIGRAIAKPILERDGDGPSSSWNFVRSGCLDISEAASHHRHEQG